MARGIQGTFVIAWSQVTVDGMPGVAPADMTQGVSWGWRGDAVRVDGPAELLTLGDADGQQDIRARASKIVRKLVGATVQNKKITDVELDGTLEDQTVLLTDGRLTYTMTLIETPGGLPLCMFVDELPPQGADLWVVDLALADPNRPVAAETGGIICFTDTTFIATPSGGTRVSELAPGDLVMTRDSGPKPILWIGRRRVSGARLHVMPQMRPIRLRANALGQDMPGGDILVSPHHRMVVQGRVALDLFNTHEVLVAAKDLVNGRSIYHEPRVREVVYHHILLESHEVLWANGVMTESFQPAHMDLATLEDTQRAQLFDLFPDLEWDRDSYGGDARRTLSASEAAILKHAR